MSFAKKYVENYELIYKDKPYQEEAEFVYDWANKPKTIVSLGCGLGKHEQYWCKHCKVIGIDGSKEMIKRAYKHPNITYLNKSIEYKSLNIPYKDCVVAMFNVLGYVLLEDCISYLPIKKGGYFIFDVWDASKFIISPPKIEVKKFGFKYRLAVPEKISKRLIKINYFIVNQTPEEDILESFETHYVEGYFKKDIEDLCKKQGYRIVSIKPTKNWKVWYKLQKL
jgi:hypothetical protein